MDAPTSSGNDIRSILVVGGGTAGYLTALALRRDEPAIEVTLLESSRIPVIGVGEATTTLMPPFLHQRLGLDIVDFYREVRPTWKLGIRFEWGDPGTYAFNYPFGSTAALEAVAYDGILDNQSVASLMMNRCRAPLVGDADGSPISLLPQMKLAYHLDNEPLVAFLARHAIAAGVRHVDAEVTDTVTSADGGSIERLILADGRELRADLYVDASGFRALLIEKALRSEFLSYASSLFCDSAIVGEVEQNEAIQPYTTAQTMDAGWCWRIPVEGADHRGYVYSSNHLDEEQARDEMRAKNPTLRDVWSLRFRSGRHHEFWKGNTVAIGNAYGFVEPLQSTAIHMVILEIAYLLGGLRGMHTVQDPEDAAADRDFANQSMGAHWDFLRWFLALHHKFNRKSESEFWRDCRHSVDVAGMQTLIDRFTSDGPWHHDRDLHYAIGDPAFSFEGLMLMMLGMKVPCPPASGVSVSQQQWAARVADCRALVDRALGQAEALAILRSHPELLSEHADAPDSWINCGGELISRVDRQSGIVHPNPLRATEAPPRPFQRLLAPLE